VARRAPDVKSFPQLLNGISAVGWFAKRVRKLHESEFLFLALAEK